MKFGKFGKKKDATLTAIVPGESGLSIAVVKQVNDRCILQTCEFSPWNPDEEHATLLGEKVKQFGLNKRPCTTVTGVGEYNIFEVEAREVPPAEMRAAVRWQVKDLIDFNVDDAVVDIFDAPVSGTYGKQTSLYAVVARHAVVKEHVDLLQDADVNLSVIDIPELVLRNISCYLPENEAGVALIYLTRDRGLVVFTRQSVLYFARTLDIGYANLQQGDLVADSGLSLDSGGPYEQLVLEVQRSLDYYDRHYAQPSIAGIVISPTEVPLPGMAQYLQEKLSVNTRQLDLNEIVECHPPLDSLTQAHCLSAIGAVMRQESKTL